MSTFSATANGGSTIGYAQYGSSSWSTGSSNGACQGAYKGTTAAKSRVGVMVFNGAGAALKGKLIQQISLSITCSGAGSGSSGKVLTFHKANYQSLNTSVRGSAQVGDTLGTLTGKFYSNTVTHTLNASTNAALFAAMKAYFEAGNSALVLYNGEIIVVALFSLIFPIAPSAGQPRRIAGNPKNIVGIKHRKIGVAAI